MVVWNQLCLCAFVRPKCVWYVRVCLGTFSAFIFLLFRWRDIFSPSFSSWFNSLFFFSYSTCVPVHVSVCLPAVLYLCHNLFFPLFNIPLRDTCLERLEAYSVDKISWLPRENGSRREVNVWISFLFLCVQERRSQGGKYSCLRPQAGIKATEAVLFY